MKRLFFLLGILICLPGARAAEALPLPLPDARPAVQPALAGDGRGNFLLVWQQGRNYFEQQEPDIYALRLDAAGRPVGQPFAVCAAKGAQEAPQVVFADGQFVVVWHDLRNGRDWDVYAARVGSDGAPRDPGGFLVAEGAANQASPVLAPAPGGAVVLWQHYGGRYYELRGAAIASSGKVGTARPLALRGETLRGGELALASFGGDRAIMAWKDETKWSLGEGTMITRHFARLRLTPAGPEVVDAERSSSVVLGREGGRFVGDGAKSAFYAGWGPLGRGQKMQAGALFSPESVTPLENPNVETKVRAGLSDTRRAITLYSPSPRIDGPVAAAYGRQGILVAALDITTEGRQLRNRIVGMHLSLAGKLLDNPDDPPPLHETERPVGSPALAAGPEGFVLVFEQDEGADKQQLMAKSVR